MATPTIDEWGLVRSYQEEAEESYFISMTDIMVGLLFIFIIMLMVFGLMLKIAEENTKSTQKNVEVVVRQVHAEVERMRDVDSLRAQMLHDIEKRLKKHGVRVIVREENGVLQLPDEILFEKAKYELSKAGLSAIRELARALDEVLPCYAVFPNGSDATNCKEKIFDKIRLEAVFVEGHTDSDGLQDYNWALSVNRAINTYRELNNRSKIATKLLNDRSQFLFSVAGYGENRPIAKETSEEEKSKNRRIDLRFVMNVLHEEALKSVQERLEGVINPP